MSNTEATFFFAFIASFMVAQPIAVFVVHWIDYVRWNRIQAAIKKQDDGSILRDFWLRDFDGELWMWEFDPGTGVKGKFNAITRSEAEAILANRRRLASMTKEQRSYPFVSTSKVAS